MDHLSCKQPIFPKQLTFTITDKEEASHPCVNILKEKKKEK